MTEEQSDKSENNTNPNFKYYYIARNGYWDTANLMQNEIKTPHIVVFYDYHHHRSQLHIETRLVCVVAKRFTQLRFFISDISEISAQPVKFKRNKPPTIYAIHGDKKFKFQDEFTAIDLHKFCREFVRTTKFKSEPLPPCARNSWVKDVKKSSTQPEIKKAVALNFHELVISNPKDVVLFLYQPSCDASKTALVHLKKLANILYESGECDNIDIVRMNLIANSLPINLDSHYAPPLLTFVRRVEKTVAVKVWGPNLSVCSMVKFVAQNSTKLLKGYDRNGDAKNDRPKQKQRDEQYDANKYYNRFHSYVTKIN